MTNTFTHLAQRGGKGMKYPFVFSLLMLFCVMMTGTVFAQHTVSGNVFLDHNGDGIENGLDFGHPVIRVNVYQDTNGNGSIDAGDLLLGTGGTDAYGDYSLSFPASTGNYLAQIETDDLLSSAVLTTPTVVFPAGSASDIDLSFRGEPVVCYTVSDRATIAAGNTAIDATIYLNRVSGISDTLGFAGSLNVEAVAFNIGATTLFASNADRLGRIDPLTGTFSPYPDPYGTGNGVEGPIVFSDVDGLTFDPLNSEFYGSVRRAGAYDLIFKIDTLSGLLIPDAFGPGLDYVVGKDAGETLPFDIDDLAINPDDGVMYAVYNSSGTTNVTQLASVDKTTGVATFLNDITYQGVVLSDVEGFGFTNFGLLTATTGSSGVAATNNSFYTIDINTGVATFVSNLEVGYNGNQNGVDYEASDCLTAKRNLISGTVFQDNNEDGVLNGNENGIANVDVNIWVDINGNGIVDAGDELATTVMTDPNGEYEFTTGSNVTFIVEVVQTTLPDSYDLTTPGTSIVDLSTAVGGTDINGIDFGAVRIPDFAFDCDATENVDVMIMGSGTDGGYPVSIAVADLTNVDSIVLEAVHTGGVAPTSVVFTAGAQAYTALAQEVVTGSNGSTNFRYYRATVPAATPLTLQAPASGSFESFVAYIFKSGTATTTAVSGQFAEIYLFVDDYTATLPIPTTDGLRNVDVTIPLTGLSATATVAEVTLTAGGVSQTFTVSNPNQGNSLNLSTFTLADVPGTATNVVVEINSPTVNGDAFIVGGIVAESGCGCPIAVIDANPSNGEICIDETIEFIAEDQGNAVNYLWTFGSGATPATAAGIGPHTVSYSTPGTKTVTLRTTKEGCTADEIELLIEVTDTPTAAIANFPSQLCTDDSGNFTATNAGAGATYTWNFGSGASPANATGPGPHGVSYNTNGTKNVTLLVSKDGCTATASEVVTVDETPGASITTAPTSICSYETATYTASNAGAGVTYSWDFGVGAAPATATGVGPHDVLYGSIGTKTVTLTTTLGACTNSDQASVSVILCNRPPDANNDMNSTFEDTPVTGTMLPNDSDPDGDNLIYTITPITPPANGTVVINPDGSYTYTPNPGFNGTDSWTYEVCDDGNPVLCDQAMVMITVGTCPTVGQINGGEIVCGSDFGTFTATNAGPGSTYTWDFGADATPANATGIGPHDVAYSSTGPKTITLVVNNQCANTTSKTIEVFDKPVANISGDGSTCANEGTLYQADNAGVGATYFWDFGPDATPSTSTDIAPIVEWSTTGTKPITLEVTKNGCTETAMLNVTVTFSVFGDAGSNVTICEGGTAQIGGKPSGPPGAMFFWDPPTGLNDRNVANPVASPSDTTEYTLFVTFNGCVSTSTVVVNVDVNSVPYAYSGEDNFVCAGQSVTLGGDIANPTGPDGASYSWSPANGLDDPFSANPIASPVVTTPYTVTVEKNGCFKTDQVLVEVLPSPPVDAGETKRLCAGSTGGVVLGGPGNNPFATFQWAPTTGLTNPTDPNTLATPTETTIYQLCATRFGCTTCDEVVVVVEDCNEPPVALNDDNNTLANVPVSGQILTNDFDPNGDNITVTPTVVTPPANGTVTLMPDGTYTYAPNPGFTGTDLWEYEICDDGLPDFECSTAIVVIEVRDNTLGNNPPIANDDAAITDENIPITSTLNPNDGDPDNDNIIVNTTPVSDPINGTVVIDPDGTYTYTPDPGFEGYDNFTYQICDDGMPVLCDNANVVILVRPDPEQNDPPVASNDAETTPVNTPVSGSILDNDNDEDDDPLTVNTTPQNGPNNGTVVINPDGTYTYVPNNNFEGVDSFDYEICDDGTPPLCDMATVIITIYEPNNSPPVAADDNASTTPNLSVDIDLTGNDSDPDSDALIVNTTPVTPPTAGVVFINPDGTARYVPNLDFMGTDFFEYEICDGISGCDIATVTITIYDDTPGQNDPPIANDDASTTPENTPVSGAVLTNDRDPDGDPIVVNPTPISNPSNGAVTILPNGSYTYTPDIGFTGIDTFVYEVCDPNSGCDQATVTIEVFGSPDPNTPPIAQDDFNSTPESTPVDGIILDNDSDPEGDVITVNTTILSGPDNGSATINSDGTYTYVPVIGFIGVDTFEYEICDDESNCDQAVVTIDVYPGPPTPKPDNVPPFADDDGEFTFEDVPVDGTLAGNDNDPEGTQLTYDSTPVEDPVNGTVDVNPDGTFTYTPNPGYIGPDQFLYEVCDAGSPIECVIATAYITVYPFNNPPVGISDDHVTFVNTPVSGQVLTNDFDPDGDNITISPNLVSTTTNGTVVLNSNGTYTYTPNQDYEGEDQFEYEICDDGTPGPLCTTTTVTITITPEADDMVNNPPIANDDDNITYVNIPIGGEVVPNDYDPDGDNLIVKTAPIIDPSAGTVVLNSDGSYVYTPLPDFVGQDQFDYEVCDDATPIECVIATVYIDVLPLPIDYSGNLPPFAGDDFNVTDEATPVSDQMLDNDTDPDNDPLIVNTTPIQDPQNGTVTLVADGTYTYTPNPGFFGTDYFLYEICDGISGCSVATVYILVNGERCVNIELAVWLEGNYQNDVDLMTTYLNLKNGSLLHRGLLPGQIPLNIGLGVPPTPAGQPYSAAPWNYAGTEGIGWTNAEYDAIEAEYGADVVDWVLVSFRTEIFKTTNFLQAAALLLEDGRVVFTEDCILSTAGIPGQLYIVVEQRNHMGVMTPAPITIDNSNTLLWDFRIQESYVATAGFGSKQIEPGVFAMYAGDSDQGADFPSYDINGTDKILWTIENGNFDQYRQSDLDLNGDVNGADKIIWSLNNGISSRVPKN